MGDEGLDARTEGQVISKSPKLLRDAVLGGATLAMAGCGWIDIAAGSKVRTVSK